jgi:hypothetical protein
MKRSILFVSAMLFTSVALAQDVTGPSVKNAKAGSSIFPKVPVVTANSPSELQGPEAKNQKMGRSAGVKVKVRTRKVIDNPTGLDAKNPRFRTDLEKADTTTRASYEEPKTMRKRRSWWH